MITPHRIGRRRAGSAPRAAAAAAVAALGAACAVCTATPARADTLTAGRAVTPPGIVACDFSLATSPPGGRVGLIYHEATGCGGESQRLIARLGRGRNLGPARVLEDRRSRSGAAQVTIFGSARIAVGADGRAVAAWVARGHEPGRDRLRVAIAAPGRGFGRARTLTRARFRPGYVSEIRLIGVVAGAGGRAVVGWALNPRLGDDASLRVAVRMRGRGFGAPQALGPISRVYFSPSAPALALAPSGIVVAAWRPGQRPTAVAATLRPGRRRFGATRKISRDDAADHVQAVAGPGGAAVSWSDDRRRSGSPIRLRLARLRRDGTLTAPSTLAAVDTAAGMLEVEGPQVALALAGPVAAWQVFRDISEAGDGRIDSTRLEAAPISPTGNLLPARILSTAGVLTGGPTVGALTDRTLVAWRERVGPGRWHMRLTVRRAGGDWQPSATFAESDGIIAMASSRRSALLLWQPIDDRAGARGPLQLAVYRP